MWYIPNSFRTKKQQQGITTFMYTFPHPRISPISQAFAASLGETWERWPLASRRGLAPGPRTAGEESLTSRWLHSSSAQLRTPNNFAQEFSLPSGSPLLGGPHLSLDEGRKGSTDYGKSLARSERNRVMQCSA